MNFTISGKITDIFPAETFGNFTKRVFWLQETEGQYPQMYSVELWGEDTELTNNYKNGDLVTCKIDLRGKHWTKGERSGVINSLKCWGMSKTQGQANQPAPGQVTQEKIKQANSTAAAEQLDDTLVDDLPF